MTSLFCNIKLETWSYEKEYRCTVGTNATDMPFVLASPKDIFIGTDCTQTYAEKLIRIADELQIPAFQMVFSENEKDFNLSLQKVAASTNARL